MAATASSTNGWMMLFNEHGRGAAPPGVPDAAFVATVGNVGCNTGGSQEVTASSKPCVTQSCIPTTLSP